MLILGHTSICLLARHGLRPFFASHARTSHVQKSVRTHTCAHPHFMVVALRTRTLTICSKWNLNATLYKKICRKPERFTNGCKQKKYIKTIWLFKDKIRNIHQFSLESGQNVWSHVCGCDQWKKGPHASTSHTCFRVHFTRTRATAHFDYFTLKMLHF